MLQTLLSTHNVIVIISYAYVRFDFEYLSNTWILNMLFPFDVELLIVTYYKMVINTIFLMILIEL